MLHALLEYAERAGIAGEAGFKPKTVRWLLQFDSRGRYLGLVPADEDRKGRTFERVPHLQFSGDTPMRQFLVDTLQYALLYGQDDPDAKLLTKHRYFLDRLRDAVAVEPVLGPIAEALADTEVRRQIHADLDTQSPKAKPSDNVTFVERTDAGPRVLVEQTTWHDWWRGYWPGLFPKKAGAKKKAGASATMRCFLSGELVEPAATHPKIKGLGDVGGNVETTLVGFNLDAFRSYGLEQSANAAVSTELAETYAAALNDLIGRHSRRLAGAKVAYWYTHDVPPEDDPLSQVLAGVDFGEAEASDDAGPATPAMAERAAAQAAGRAGELLEAIHSSRRADLRDCRYRALTLGGNAGRVVVRDWMEGQFEDLAGHVAAWFEDLSIVRRDGQGLAKPPKFLAVLGSLARDLKDVPAPLETALFRAAVTGGPIPFDAMARALARTRIDCIQDNPPSHARMGLLKACLIRKEICAMTAELTDSINDPAYVCGRVMALLAKIQHAALGDVGAGVVQRYYAAASATPALVLGRLVRLAQTGHLPKIDVGLRHWFDDQLAATFARISRSVPATLTLEEQTLFALGYYHQKAKRHNGESAAASDAE